MSSKKSFPTHVAIIMDGNGRWATRRHFSRLVGHKHGVFAVQRTIDAALELGIKILTFFAFSTENWKRDKAEVDGIFDIVRLYITDYLPKLQEKNIKLTVMGDISKLPDDLFKEINFAVQKTENNTGLVLNVAVNYGAKDELARAFNLLIGQGKKFVTSEDIAQNLYSVGLPDPDLIIRTSGEQRLSNFMLYQSAYAELYFCKVFWPSFGRRHLKKALKNYSRRERRYGGNHN